MPTYTINTQGDPASNAWAEGASALAKALTPDYEEQAKAALYGAQADRAYASAASSLATRDKTYAEKGLIDRERNLLAEMDRRFTEAGITDPMEKSMIATEFGMRIDPVEWTKDLGKKNLAIGAMQGLPDERLGQLQTGAGLSFGDTIPGFNATMENENQRWLEEQAAAKAEAEAERQAETARKQMELDNALLLQNQEPVVLGENQIAVVPNTNSLYGQSEGGVLSGNRSLTDNEQILDPSGEVVAEGPNFVKTPADEPGTFEMDIGNETVTFIYDPEDPRRNEFGFVEIARAPRVGNAGEPVQDAATAAFIADDAVTLETALEAGRGATDRIVQIDQTLAMLDAGVPTGFWTNVTMPVRQALTSFGIADPEKTGRIEALTSDLGNRVMARIQETKGAVSNAEMDYFRRISASIGNTPYGNRILLEKERAVHERAQRMRNYARSLRGKPPDVIAQKLEEFREQNPIFTEEDIQRFAGLEPNPELGIEVAVPSVGDEPDLTGIDFDRY